jgi:hypothetical protein
MDEHCLTRPYILTVGEVRLEAKCPVCAHALSGSRTRRMFEMAGLMENNPK